MLKQKIKFLFSFFLFSGILPVTLSSQCLQLIDGNNTPSTSPYWVNCSGSAYTLNLIATSSFGAYTVDWGDGVVDNGVSYNAGDTIVHVYAAATDTFVLMLNTTAPVCQITGVVVMESSTLTAIATMPAGSSSKICSGQSLQFTNSSTGVSSTTTFTWDFGDGTTQTFSSANAGQTVSHAYNAANVNCMTDVKLTATNYCITNDNEIDSIFVFKKDIVAVTADANFKCGNGAPFTFTNASTPNCFANGNTTQRFQRWNFHNYWGLGYDSLSAWTSWPPASQANITFPTVGTFVVTLIDSSFCGLDSANKTVIISNAPSASFSISTDTACVNSVFTFTNTSTTGFTYKWNFGDNGTFTPLSYTAAVSHAYSNPGTYTVSLAALVGAGNATCRDTEKVVVTVLAPPTSAFSASALTGCDSLSVSLTDNSVGATTWNWKLNGATFSNQQNPGVQNLTPGTHTISLTVTSADGCIATSQQTFTVNQSPLAGFTSGTVCEGAATIFTDTSTPPSGNAIVSWQWDFGDGSPASVLQNPNHQYAAAGIYIATLIVSTGFCTDTTTASVTVNANPIAAFTAVSDSGCTPFAVSFQNNSTGAATYAWDFDNGSVSSLSNPSAIYLNTGTVTAVFTPTLIAASAAGCQDTITSVVTVFPKPQSAFSFTPSNGCAPLSTAFTNTSSGANSFSWDFGDGSSLSALISPSHIYQNSGSSALTNTIQLIATSAFSCSDTAMQSIQIFPEASFSFTMSSDSGCAPLSVIFSAAAGGINYQWTFGDGNSATGQTFNHFYFNSSTGDTTFIAELIATTSFGCTDTITDTVAVFGLPVAGISAASLTGCSPFAVNFSNTSLGAVSQSWDFGDGTPSSPITNPSHSFSNSSISSAAAYTVMLSVTNSHGCIDSASTLISVEPVVVAAFTADTPLCGPGTLTFTNNSGGSTVYNWDFGDGNGSVLASPSHFYSISGTGVQNFSVTLVASNSAGCSDTTTSSINIYPTPVALFNAAPASQVFPSANVSVTNNSVNVSGWFYIWNFGDGTGSSTLFQPAPHSYSSPGTYTITLIISNGNCSDTVQKVITILPPVPIASFTGTHKGCAPLTANFINTSLYGTSYSWDFGDGSTSASSDAAHVYTIAGNYTVTLIVVGAGGSDTIIGTDSVTVYGKPVADFSASPNPVNIPDGTVTFSNSSVGANSYSWDFGDGTTSTQANPAHVYTEGEYQVVLYAYNANGCVDTFYNPSIIKAESKSEIKVPNAFTPNPNHPSDDGIYNPSAMNNDIFHPVMTGIKKYDLRIYNRWGELVFATEDQTKGWDGYYKGKLCPQDVYIWKIVAESFDDQVIKKAGDVLLLR